MARPRRRGRYVFTPARANALKAAREKRSQLAKTRRKANVGQKRRIYSSNPVTRGVGISGARKNFVPYARINQRSQTGGYNVGSIIPGTGKRIVTGAYVRLENVKRGGVISSALSHVAPKGSLLGKGRKYFNENVTVDNPGIRASVGGSQVRLGTSRTGGLTLTARRGKHKVPQKISKKGLKQYDLRIAKIRRKQLKQARAQRRGA